MPASGASDVPQPAGSPGPVTALGQVAIPVRDRARALAFYRDALGLPLLFEAPPGLAFLMCGPVRVMLAEPEPGAAFVPGGLLYFTVTDLAGAVRGLEGRGVEVLHPPRLVAPMADHDLWMAFVRDPDGHAVGLMQEVRPPAPR